MSIELISQRGDFGTEIYEKPDFQTKVKEAYERLLADQKYVEIDAGNDIQFVSKSVLKKVEEFYTGWEAEPLVYDLFL